MKKILSICLIFIISMLFVPSLKAEETTTTLSSVSTTIVSDSDTSTTVTNSTPLVTVPLSWGTRILTQLRLWLSRDSLQRADLTLKLTQDDLIRLERSTTNIDALKKALANYTKAIDELKTRLENLKATSNNPNIDKLLNKLTDLEIRHQEVFDRLINNATSTKPLLEQLQNRFNQSILPLHLRFENQEEFVRRLEQGLNNVGATSTAVGEFRQLRIMETLRTQLQQMNLTNLATSTQEQINRLQERLNDRIQQRIQVLEKQGFSSSTVNQILENTPQPVPVFKKLPQTPPPGVTTTPSTLRLHTSSTLHPSSTIRRGR